MMTLFLETFSIYSLSLLNSMRYRKQKREGCNFKYIETDRLFFFFPMIWICLINRWSLHKISCFCGGIHMKKTIFISVLITQRKFLQWKWSPCNESRWLHWTSVKPTVATILNSLQYIEIYLVTWMLK